VSDHVPDGTVGVIGVIDMELLSVIRRWHYRDHMPICEIERRTGLSRNTIRKYLLRSNAVEIKFKAPVRPSCLDPFAHKLSGWLRIEAGKGRKVRLTARQLHADLAVLGYTSSFAHICVNGKPTVMVGVCPPNRQQLMAMCEGGRKALARSRKPLSSPSARRAAGRSAEHCGEVGRRTKTASKCYIGNRHGRIGQHRLGALDPALDLPAMGW
jgi:hypothetical protein